MQSCTEFLEQGYQWLLDEVRHSEGGVVILGGNRGDNGELLDYQEVNVVMENGMPTAKEHFGYTDGIGDPVFEGVALRCGPRTWPWQTNGRRQLGTAGDR